VIFHDDQFNEVFDCWDVEFVSHGVYCNGKCERGKTRFCALPLPAGRVLADCIDLDELSEESCKSGRRVPDPL
jgi:predicted nucleic acid binding AN1-type Zn finger protein